MKKTIQEKVLAALKEIRPFLKTDGGDIALKSIDGSVVSVVLKGSCVCCSINQMTLKNGVEAAIKRNAPEITEVIDVSGTI